MRSVTGEETIRAYIHSRNNSGALVLSRIARVGSHKAGFAEILTKDQERALIEADRSGDQKARDELVRAFRPLLIARCRRLAEWSWDGRSQELLAVHKPGWKRPEPIKRQKGVRRPRQKQPSVNNLERGDFYTAAIIGFLHAVDSFDLTLPYRLSTHAWQKIDAELQKVALNHRQQGRRDESRIGRWLRANWRRRAVDVPWYCREPKATFLFEGAARVRCLDSALSCGRHQSEGT